MANPESESSSAPVILLAGGKSSRMGQPKGLIIFKGRPWIETQLAHLADCGFRDAILVLGYDADLYLKALPWLEATLCDAGGDALGLHIRSVINPLPEYGPFSSIQAGGKCALSAASVWILPIDVPCPEQIVWNRLSQSTSAVCVPTYQGHGGHPVRISNDFLTHLLKQPPDGPDSRLDHQIRLAGRDVQRLEVEDPVVLKNLNQPADWA